MKLLLLSLLAAGRIFGTVAYAGSPVRAQKIVRTDARCKRPLTDPTVTLSKSGKAVVNVLVRVTAGLRPAAEAPTEAIVIEQKDCMYEPRVQGAVKGQRVVVRNADGTMHNVHAFVGVDDKKTLFNVAQPSGAADFERDVRDVVGTVRFTCDLHAWMRAYVVFSEHAAFAVTDAEGKWSLELPAGTYTLEAWHEKLGTTTAEVKVEEGKTHEVELSLSPRRGEGREPR